MNGFFKLIQQFTTQAEPAFCGITSLVQVMNALEVDPRRTWKGAWRWYSEDMLDCCKSLDEIKKVRHIVTDMSAARSTIASWCLTRLRQAKRMRGTADCARRWGAPRLNQGGALTEQLL